MPADREQRRYTDEEVRHLLGRASDLEAEGARPLARIPGPTLPELEEIAAEAGIDPALVRRAAQELDAPVAQPSDGRTLAGVPLRTKLDRVVEGQISTEALEEMLGSIQRATGDTGHPTVLHHSLSWRSTESSHRHGATTPTLNISVTSAHGETRITVIEEYGNVARRWSAPWIVAGVGGAVPVGIGVFGTIVAAFPVGAAILGAGFLVTRRVVQRKARERRADLQRLLDELAQLVQG